MHTSTHVLGYLVGYMQVHGLNYSSMVGLVFWWATVL